ncbi:MAG: hypothetical protein WDZ76_07845 [Pseudohongiellaceae bacterium]
MSVNLNHPERLAGLLLLGLVLAAGPAGAQMLLEQTGGECVYGDCGNGRGTMEIRVPQGKAVYRGYFKDGEFHGQGRLEEPLSPNDKAIYDGNWEAGQRSGRGTFWNGKGNLYIGQWRNDVRHGRGSYFFNLPRWDENRHTEFWLSRNIENYTGEFRDDLYHGEGSYRWADGNRYEGEFFANDKHGPGTFYYSTGTAREQFWEHGELLR